MGVRAERPMIGKVVREQTARNCWAVLKGIEKEVFLWNLFPFHPHKAENSFTNRSHAAHERKIGEELMAMIRDLLMPRRVICVGRDSEVAARRVFRSREVFYIRHPSFGGKWEFYGGMAALYGALDLPLFGEK